MAIIVRARIACSIDTVFDMYMQPALRTEWDDNVLRAYYLAPDEPIAVGTQFNVIVTAMRQERETIRTITEYDPPHRMTYETHTAGLAIRSEQTFTSISGQTNMTMHATITGSGLRAMLAWVVSRQMQSHIREGMASFKQLVETRCH